MQVLDEAEEQYDRRNKLKASGYDPNKVEQKVLGIFTIAKEELYSGSRKRLYLRQGVYSVFGVLGSLVKV